MTTIAFIVPSIPVAQPRQRHALIAGHLRNYTPAKHPVNAFKASCQLAARQSYAGPPLTGPLMVTLTFVLPRPKSTPKRQRIRMPHAKKPDIENLAKSCLDALTGLLYADDRQIYWLQVLKMTADADEQPCVFVVIRSEES